MHLHFLKQKSAVRRQKSESGSRSPVAGCELGAPGYCAPVRAFFNHHGRRCGAAALHASHWKPTLEPSIGSRKFMSVSLMAGEDFSIPNGFFLPSGIGLRGSPAGVTKRQKRQRHRTHLREGRFSSMCRVWNDSRRLLNAGRLGGSNLWSAGLAGLSIGEIRRLCRRVAPSLRTG